MSAWLPSMRDLRAGRAENDRDDTHAVALCGRHEAIASCVSVAGLHAINRIISPQQVVAVRLLDVVKREFLH